MIPTEHTKTAYTYRSESQAHMMVSVASVCFMLKHRKMLCLKDLNRPWSKRYRGVVQK